MKICSLILLYFLVFSNVQAQVKSGKVVYNLELTFKPNEISEQNNSAGNSTLAKMLKEAEKDLKEVKGILEFNSKMAYFTKEIPMQINKSPALNISLSLLGLRNEGYFSNVTEGEKLKVSENLGKTYLIEDDLVKKENWNVTQEMKVIGKYNVYRATTTEVVENSKGKFENQVTAWFAPEIPYSFGPLGYGGLPGLILQLEINSNFPSKYTVESVEFSDKEIKIEAPRGQRISKEEMDKMARKAMNNL
ncbi:GLPGLI family protein [Salegentibacter sp. Hel_I_6]|uniref:GLPGLI family protein n=1 Tax=Salegentibacter sp. Hel_I_6 TaxID=1250278 RepID=UPI00056BF79E|nr:GLPGLI family protein [Salegentibacter sp. Hel_I_6]